MKATIFTLTLLLVGCGSNPPSKREVPKENPPVGTIEHKLWSQVDCVALITTQVSSKVGGKTDILPKTAGFLWEKDSTYYLIAVGHLIPSDYDGQSVKFYASFKYRPATSYEVRPVHKSLDPDLSIFSFVDKNFQFNGVKPKFNSELPKAGDHIFILGHPFGLSYAISEGKIFAPICAITGTQTNLFCHVAANGINALHVGHGSSGGPIFNSDGEIIGMHIGAISGLEIEKKPAVFGLAVPMNEISKKLEGWLKEK